MGDLGEERAHVLVAMALAGGVVLGGGPSGQAMPAGDRGLDAVAQATSPLQRTTEAKSAEIQTPVACGAAIAVAPLQGGRPRSSAMG
jgi:hypothetical protein